MKSVPGVYVSYPFCAQKCTFCNFASEVYPRAGRETVPSAETRYLETLTAEIRAHRWQWTPETVYLGGGTPGNLEPEALGAILDGIPGKPWQEATIESAPGGLTPEKARAWAAAGINRVSLGVQSFVAKEIRRTGRKHSAETVACEVQMLADAGIHNFNIDLIAGLSGQTEATWRESLAWVERLNAPHVSVYMLEVDDDSRLGREILHGGSRYGAAETPDEDHVAAFYEIAVERLAAAGIPRYEISNFAPPGYESRHNLKYWKLEPYAGFGADAHSFDGAVRSQNPESIEAYLAGSGATPPVRTPAHADERLFIGLRLAAGVRPTPEEWRRFEGPISRFVAEGLLETGDGFLRLTGRGVLLSNEVFQEFLDT